MERILSEHKSHCWILFPKSEGDGKVSKIIFLSGKVGDEMKLSDPCFNFYELAKQI